MHSKNFEILQNEIDNGKQNITLIKDMKGRIGNHNRGLERYMRTKGEDIINNKEKTIITYIYFIYIYFKRATNTKFEH